MIGFQKPLKALSRLKLSPAQKAAHERIDPTYRLAYSRFPSEKSDVYWFLHPECVTPPSACNGPDSDNVNYDEWLAMLCFRCDAAMNLHENEKGSIPETAVKNRHDYGDIRRLPNYEIDYPPSSIAESMVLSLARPWCITLQLSVGRSHIPNQEAFRTTLKTHMITMPFAGGCTINNMLTQIPRPASEISDLIKIVFIGMQSFRLIRTSLLAGVKHALVRRDVVFNKSKLLQKVNKEYLTVPVPNMLEDIAVDAYDTLRELPVEFKADITSSDDAQRLVPENVNSTNVFVLNTKKISRIHEVVNNSEGRDIAGVRDLLEEQESNEFTEGRRGIDGTEGIECLNSDTSGEEATENEQTIDLTSSAGLVSVISSSSLIIQPDGSIEDGLKSKTAMRLNELRSIQATIQSAAPITESDAETVRPVDEYIPMDTDIPAAAAASTTTSETNQQHLQQSTSRVPISVVPIPVRQGDTNPLNEYTEHERIRYHCHPELFLFGEGAPKGPTMTQREADHYLRQRSGKFAASMEFNFREFNTTQRHKASQVIARKIKNNPEAMEKAAEMFNSEEFKELLDKALETPEGEEANEVLKRVNPILKGISHHIPFSGEERAMVLSDLYANMETFGNSSNFLTFSMDDTNDTVLLRLCYGSVTNSRFPATDEIEFENGNMSFKEVN